MAHQLTLTDFQPEDELLEQGGVAGVAVRLHQLGRFWIYYFAVLQQGSVIRAVRRELKAIRPGELLLNSEEEFGCPQSFPAKLCRDLDRLGIGSIDPFFAEDVLDGTLLECRLRPAGGALRHVQLFCWQESEDAQVRQVGDYLQELALSTIRRLRWRAFASRFWW